MNNHKLMRSMDRDAAAGLVPRIQAEVRARMQRRWAAFKRAHPGASAPAGCAWLDQMPTAEGPSAADQLRRARLERLAR